MKNSLKIIAAGLIILSALISAGCADTVEKTASLPLTVEETEISYAEANGINIAYKQFGSGFPLVMVAGFGCTMDSWQPDILNAFAEEYTVTIFDNRGMGYTELGDITPEEMSYSLYAKDTVALMDTLGINKADLLGWSMGTGISQEIVLSCPDRISKVILYAASYGGDSDADKELRQKLEKAVSEPVSDEEQIRDLFPEDWLICHDPEDYLPVNTEPASDTGIKASNYATQNWEGTFEQLNRINIPVMLLVGTEDALTPDCLSAEMAQEIDGSWLVRYNAGGHGMMYQNPDDFAKTVLFFLSVDQDLSC